MTLFSSAHYYFGSVTIWTCHQFPCPYAAPHLNLLPQVGKASFVQRSNEEV